MKVETYRKIMKVLASIALLGQNLYYANTQPGFMDALNGAISGLVFYAIWFAQERTK